MQSVLSNMECFFNIQYFTIQVEEVEFFNFMRILKFELSESGEL